MNSKKTHHLIIPDVYANDRVDHALTKLLPDYSRTQIKEWIEAGLILVNGKAVKPKMHVMGGETVAITAVSKAQPAWEAQAIPLAIVFEDEEVMVVNKPVGMVVHPGAGNFHHTLLNALLHHAPQLQTLPRAGILHRLDKNTSGLLIVAKTSRALHDLSKQLKKRLIVREYQAIVYGSMISGGRVDVPIGRHPHQRTRMAVVETGKPAVTHYRIAEKYPAFTRLKIRLETGRTHQIRLHMAHLHHPIVGDMVYGGRMRLAKGLGQELVHMLRGYKRQALHAFAVGFTHPVSQEWLHFEIDLPEDMQQLVELLRKEKKA